MALYKCCIIVIIIIMRRVQLWPVVQTEVLVAAAGEHFEHSVYILSGQLTFISEKFELSVKSCAKIRYDWLIDWYLINTQQTYMYSWEMIMKVKYKNTNTIKTQIQVTYTERGNGVEMTFIQLRITLREFIYVPFGSKVVCTRLNRG